MKEYCVVLDAFSTSTENIPVLFYFFFKDLLYTVKSELHRENLLFVGHSQDDHSSPGLVRAKSRSRDLLWGLICGSSVSRP